jgi:hypothetical protein
MDTGSYHDFTHRGETVLTPADEAAVLQFEDALNTCIGGWNRGEDAVILPINIQERFSDALLQYFERSLTDEVGAPVALTIVNKSGWQQTLVQIPSTEKHQLLLQTQSDTIVQTQSSSLPDNKADIVSMGMKKAPRPMNCWIIFRDAMHKQLKVENPHLTVQQICKYLNFSSTLTILS